MLEKKIRDLLITDRDLKVEAIVLRLDDIRYVIIRNTGIEAKVRTVLLGDDTGEIRLSLWNENVEKLSVGDRVIITGAYLTTYQGNTQLNTSRNGTLTVI